MGVRTVVQTVDTSYLPQGPPSPRPGRPLEFTENKRNFITDKLFAGNIHVGSVGEAEGDNDVDNDEHHRDYETFSSWRESFNRKMSS